MTGKATTNSFKSCKLISLALVLLAFHSMLARAATTNELLTVTNTWRHWQGGSLDGVNWKAPDYDDVAWPSGPALFYNTPAALPAPKNTPLTLGRRTYYFRTHFTYSGGVPEIALEFSSLIDDGAVFYLNGVEIQRVGMNPFSAITYNTLPIRSVDNATGFDRFTLTGNVLTNLVLGDNVLAVELHQEDEEETTLEDLVFGTALDVVTEIVPEVTRGPYLQNGSHTNITVRWRTDVATVGRVRHGTNLANLDLIADGSVTAEHEVWLTHLLPATRYYYSIGTTNAALAGGDTNHFFVTSPNPGTRQPTRIWAIGDSGSGDAGQVAVRDAYETFTGARHTDLWLMLGDNAYNNGTDLDYQLKLFNIYTNLLRRSVVWPTLGNHDTGSSTVFKDTYPYFNIFSLPKDGEAGGIPSGLEHFYSFDYGNIHFICLDSMTADRTPNGPMYAWLTNDLAHVTADWIIAYWHHPPYSKGSHDSDNPLDSNGSLVQMRVNFLPVLEAGGVDLVLSGHSHSYERSRFLTRHYDFSPTLSTTNVLDAGSGREDDTGVYRKPAGGPIAHQGTVYAVVGCSGVLEGGGSFDHPVMHIALQQLGSLVLDIAGDRLDAKFITSTGTTNDYFTILKTNAPPVLDPIADQVVEANQALVLTNFARDFVLPGEELEFSLLSAPVGARIRNLSSTNAVFSWVPACAQGGTTNIVIVQVSDHGTPPLSATQSFVVTVPDCVQVGLGRAVVRAGDMVSVPVELLATVALSNVVFQATYPAERFTNATLLINPQQVAAAPLFNQPGNGLLDVGLEFQSNHTLRLSTNIATLGFTIFSNQSSAFVWLTLPDVVAQRFDGSVVTNAYGVSGRVVVVGEEPLLEALHAPSNQVMLLQYAVPDSLIRLEWRTNVIAADWQALPPVTQTNLVQEAGTLTPALPARFFRALRGTNGL
jgi:hypothetical protein